MTEDEQRGGEGFEPLEPARLLFATPRGCMILIFAGASVVFFLTGLSYFMF